MYLSKGKGSGDFKNRERARKGFRGSKDMLERQNNRTGKRLRKHQGKAYASRRGRCGTETKVVWEKVNV